MHFTVNAQGNDSEGDNFESYELGYTQIELQFYGVYSRTLESFHQKSLRTLLVDLLKNDREFQANNWVPSLDSLHDQYMRTEKVDEESLFAFLPAGKYKNGVYVIFEKFDEHYYCDIYLISDQKQKSQKIKSLHLYSSIQSSIRKGALHIHGALRQYFNLEEKPESPTVLMELKVPVLNATLVKNDEILSQDTVEVLYHASDLILSERASPQIINGSKIKFILYPNSSYTFRNSSSIKLNYGKLGLILLGQRTQVYTPAIGIKATNAMFSMSHADKSEVRVFAGKTIVHPLFETTTLDTIPYPFMGSSMGHFVTKKKMSDAFLTAEFKLFMPYLSSEIIKYFKVGDNTLFKDPVYLINYFSQDVTAPVDYFIADGFTNMGTPFDALQFEGEAWHSTSKTFTPDINETGCFLCNPSGISNPSP